MARDYAKTRSSNGRKKPRKRPAAKRKSTSRAAGIPGWVWLFCGLCIGLTAAAGVYVFGRPAGSSGLKVAGIEIPATGGADESGEPAPDDEPAKDPSPRFAFYEMLPNYEVVIPEEEYTGDTERSQTTTRKVEQPGRYVIQAGSFSNHDDADRRKAGLALLGIESSIEEVRLESGRVVYRVRTATLESTERLNATLRKLDEKGIDSLVMRVKG